MTTIDRRYSVAEGTSVKAPCRVATTANITLSGEQTIDGVAVVARDRVLVKDQTDATTNGIYEVSTGNWSRAKDFDGAYDVVNGTRCFVTYGSTNGLREYYVTTADPITIGTSSINFGYLSGGSGGGASEYDTRAIAEATNIPAAVSWVEVSGFSTVGDGGRQIGIPIATPAVAKRWHWQDANLRWRELSANEFYPEMLGANGNGVYDNTAIFQDLFTIDVNGAARKILLTPGKTYAIDGIITASGKNIIEGYGAVVTQSGTSGGAAVPLIKGLAVPQMYMLGGEYTGLGPDVSYDGNGDPNQWSNPPNSAKGLLYFHSSNELASGTKNGDLVFRDVKVSATYSGISALGTSRLLFDGAKISNYRRYGIVASLSTDVKLNNVHTYGCTETEAMNCYGFSATGDETGGSPLKTVHISNSTFEDNVSWDGVMTHDCQDFVMTGCILKNNRMGVDVGNADATTYVRRIVVANNYIEGTPTDGWAVDAGAGTTANAGGIAATQYSTGTAAESIVISNNIIRRCFQATGANYYSGAGTIVVKDGLRAVVTGNIIYDNGQSGASGSCAGILLSGSINDITLSDNILEGYFEPGAIRFANASINHCHIGFHNIRLNDTTDVAVYVDGTSSIDRLMYDRYSTNAVTPYSSDGTVTVRRGPDNVVMRGVTGTTATASLLDVDGLEFNHSAGPQNFTGVTDAIPGKIYTFSFIAANTVIKHNTSFFLTDGGTDQTPTIDDVLLFYAASSTKLIQCQALINAS